MVEFMDRGFLLYGFYASVFMAALLLADGFWRLYRARRQGTMTLRRRLADRAPQALPDARGNLRRERPGIGRTLAGFGLPCPGDKLLEGIAGLAIIVSLAATALTLLTDVPAVQLWFLAALAFAAGIGLAAAYMRVRAARRLARFAIQLPDALDVMVRSLRAGHPVTAAMSMVARDLPEPIAGEFSKAVNEMTYGLDLRQALGHLAERVDVPDLRFVVATVRLQFETGGNLAEVLQSLADLMRVRVRLAGKVQAFTAEARLSARILAVMPLIFVALIFWASPDIYGKAASDPLFFPVLLAAGGLQIFGILVMGRMARIRV